MNINSKTITILIFSLLMITCLLQAKPSKINILKSAIIPGWGELSSNNSSGYVFLSTEILLWSSRIYFDEESKYKLKQSKQFAINYADINPDAAYSESYYEDLEDYLSWNYEPEGYNYQIYQEALSKYPYPEDADAEDIETVDNARENYIQNNAYPENQSWDWESKERKRQYKVLRKEVLDYKDYFKTVGGLIIVNHLISVFNTLRITTSFKAHVALDREMKPKLVVNYNF